MGIEKRIVLDDNQKKILVDLMLMNRDVVIHSKTWGVKGLEEVRGSVYGIYPGILIDFLRDGENDFRHFCGAFQGMSLVTSAYGNTLFYKNVKVLNIDKLGYSEDKPLEDKLVKGAVIRAGVFYIYPELLPKDLPKELPRDLLRYLPSEISF
jgi:hypothetical protein